MGTKKSFADSMREATASAGYRKVQKEMRNLIKTFSTVRHVFVTNPNEQTIEILELEGFTVTKTSIKEYIQYKVSW